MRSKVLPMEQIYPLMEDQLERGGATILAVTGSSMLPTLRQGRDMAVLKKPEHLKRGSIILYRRYTGQFVLHRIVQVQDSGFLCCGDNQWQTEAVEPNQVLAAVAAVRRRGREVPADGPLSRLWLALFPARRPLLAIRRRLGRIKRIWKSRGR